MNLTPFKLERFFADHEFNVRYVLSASDPESLAMSDLLALADDETRGLWDRLSLGYTESQGHPLLRSEIAGLYEQINARDVLVAAPEECIFVAMHALLRPGDHVIALSPAYQSLHEVARAIGCEVTSWRLEVEKGGESDAWRLDLDALADQITERTRLLIVNFPHNPTGYLPLPGEQAAVVELARSRGLYLFSDEMYRGLEHTASWQLPAACDLYERALSLSGLSKSFGLPGLRVGWLASPDAGVLAACGRIKDYTTICSSAPGEILAIIALRARERILARSLALIRSNLQTAQGFFAAHPGLLRWLPPAAGSIAFPAVTGRIPVDDFCRALLAQESVLLAPAHLFDYPGNHFRLGLGRANFAEALARVEEFVRKMPISA